MRRGPTCARPDGSRRSTRRPVTRSRWTSSSPTNPLRDRDLMDVSEALDWLNAHVNLETGVGAPSGTDRRKPAPTLARIRALCALLGSPELEFPSIHLTGTNGKTSVTRMITALLETAGIQTGAYTSPHLSRVNERIALRGE